MPPHRQPGRHGPDGIAGLGGRRARHSVLPQQRCRRARAAGPFPAAAGLAGSCRAGQRPPDCHHPRVGRQPVGPHRPGTRHSGSRLCGCAARTCGGQRQGPVHARPRKLEAPPRRGLPRHRRRGPGHPPGPAARSGQSGGFWWLCRWPHGAELRGRRVVARALSPALRGPHRRRLFLLRRLHHPAARQSAGRPEEVVCAGRDTPPLRRRHRLHAPRPARAGHRGQRAVCGRLRHGQPGPPAHRARAGHCGHGCEPGAALSQQRRARCLPGPLHPRGPPAGRQPRRHVVPHAAAAPAQRRADRAAGRPARL